MINVFRNIERIFSTLLVQEHNPINRARIKMLSYILILYSIFTGILIVAYALTGETLHLIRVSIVFLLVPVLIGLVCYTKAWKLASHLVLICITMAVWTNLVLYVKGVNIETVQFIWLACVLSFYMFGLKWGWFYSAINILPILVFTITDKENYFFMDAEPQEVSQYIYLFVISYNFFLILFLHYYFFQVFTHNLVRLTETRDELKRLNDKLEYSLVEVKKLSKARMNFLSTMSHELRTPLNGVIGISNAMMMQEPREDQKENLSILRFSAENLLSLINDILDFNKFDSDKVELENISFNLLALVRNNFLSIKPNAKEKMLELNLVVPEELEHIRVVSDPTRLTQVLLNLLNNAIKFTEKGQVSLHLTILGSTDNNIEVRFQVTDTGIGIDKDKQVEIFEPFIQASTSTNRNFGGTGLGLPIVKKVLSLFNSHIEVESKLNRGTSFHFDILFENDHSALAIAVDHEFDLSKLATLRVLVAEDNPVNVLVIRKTLEQWNIDPVIAENGLRVVEILQKDDFDVILMDLYMPEMDGYDATRVIRKLPDPVKSTIPIIALTANSNMNVTEKVLEAGMDDCLSKPFNPQHLCEKLSQCIPDQAGAPML